MADAVVDRSEVVLVLHVLCSLLNTNQYKLFYTNCYCPDCWQLSTSGKEWTLTRPRDLPVGGTAVLLQWRKRRWRCRTEPCARASFTELPARARTTIRLRGWRRRSRTGEARRRVVRPSTCPNRPCPPAKSTNPVSHGSVRDQPPGPCCHRDRPNRVSSSPRTAVCVGSRSAACPCATTGRCTVGHDTRRPRDPRGGKDQRSVLVSNLSLRGAEDSGVVSAVG